MNLALTASMVLLLSAAAPQAPSFADRLVDAAVAQVPNLQVFFRRAGAALPIARDAAAYRPGDLVTWMLPHNLPHIGVITRQKSGAGTPLVVHNIGRGPEVDDILFAYPITGHYRYGSQ